MIRKQWWMCAALVAVTVLCFGGAAIAANPGPVYLSQNLVHGTHEGGGIELPVVLQLPWHVLLRHDVEESRIKDLRDGCQVEVLELFKVVKPVERMKKIRALDLKYRRKLLDLCPDEKKAKLRELFGNMDRLRAMAQKYKARLQEKCEQLGFTIPDVLYSDCTTGNGVVDSGKQVLLFCGDAVLVRKHILLNLLLDNPGMKLDPEKRKAIEAKRAERDRLLAAKLEVLPPIAKVPKLRQRRIWYRNMVLETMPIVVESNREIVAMLDPAQQEIIRGIFKVATEAENDMGGCYKDVVHTAEEVGGNDAQ